MKQLFSIFITILLFTACSNEKKPRVVYDETQTVALKKDTSLLVVADLPFLIDSTNFLVHPIGEIKMYKGRNKIFSGSGSYEMSTNFSVSNYNNYTISGNLSNLKFEQLGTNKLLPLTDKILRITSAQFLADLYKKTGKQRFIYDIIDTDSNKDGVLDYNDIKTLYMSNIDGGNFTCLLAPNHELLEWKIIEPISRLYLKTIEDSNKNGFFDQNDRLHYSYISLLDDTLKVIAYYPN